MTSNLETRESSASNTPPAPRRARTGKMFGIIAVLIAAAGGTWYWKTHQTAPAQNTSGASGAPGGPGGPGGGRGRGEVVPVTVGTVSTRSVPVELRAIGNVEAFSTVAVRALVSGELLKVHFGQGEDVRKNQTLFTIDPRPLQAALEQAQAQYAKDAAQKSQLEAVLMRDLALQKNAQQQAARYKQLLNEGVVSIDQEQQFRLNAETTSATIEADKANIKNIESLMKSDQASIDNAKIQLSYATIKSPIDGRTGNLQVYAGNLIKANDANPLVTINQISPVYVTFSVPEQELARIRASRGKKGFAVAATLANNEASRTTGELIFVDNTVDPATGTIKLKARMANAQHILWPGQFVNVTMTLGNDENAIVAPASAVQTGQDGFFVYVVKPDQTVELRQVKTGPSVEGVTVITSGLQAGETVVTDGQLRLVPNSKIQVAAPGGGGGRGGRGGQGGGQGVGQGGAGGKAEGQASPGAGGGQEGGRRGPGGSGGPGAPGAGGEGKGGPGGRPGGDKPAGGRPQKQ